MKSIIFMNGLRWAHFLARHWRSGAAVPAFDVARAVARMAGGFS
ncbi:hypothetical protein BH11PSE13_BH11PSE13_41410 [soil metagenome]